MSSTMLGSVCTRRRSRSRERSGARRRGHGEEPRQDDPARERGACGGPRLLLDGPQRRADAAEEGKQAGDRKPGEERAHLHEQLVAAVGVAGDDLLARLLRRPRPQAPAEGGPRSPVRRRPCRRASRPVSCAARSRAVACRYEAGFRTSLANDERDAHQHDPAEEEEERRTASALIIVNATRRPSHVSQRGIVAVLRATSDVLRTNGMAAYVPVTKKRYAISDTSRSVSARR